MGRRILVCAGGMLVVGAGLQGQTGFSRAAQPPDLAKLSSEHVVFFSGKVMMDEGIAPSEPVRVERICDGRATFAAWTGDKGDFSFKVTPGNEDVLTDDASRPNAQSPDMNRPMNASASQYSAPITSALRGCELQAVLSGYRSERVSMNLKSMMDSARVGTIILHSVSHASALTVSATSLAAPSSARKAYEKGLEGMRTQKLDAAAAEFNKAVKIYPGYAVAWYQLGVARQGQNDAAGAVEAWKQALAGDPKYIRPYESLTALADRLGNWAESENYSRLWIQLDAEDFPVAYLFNAVANGRLNRTDEAERAAREGLRLDKDGLVLRLNYVLGLILMNKKEYTESARCLRKYLELAPNAGDAAIVRQQLPKVEALAANSPAK